MSTSTVGGVVRWEVYNRRTREAPVSFTTRRAAEAWRGYMGLHAGRWVVRVSRARVEVDAESLYAVEVSSLVSAGAPYEVAQRLAAPARTASPVRMGGPVRMGRVVRIGQVIEVGCAAVTR